MVDEGLRAFNVERMYGGEMKVSDLVDAANTLPMMVPRRVVIVLEAEKLFIPKRESKAAEEELQRLEEFLRRRPITPRSCSSAERSTCAGAWSSG